MPIGIRQRQPTQPQLKIQNGDEVKDPTKLPTSKAAPKTAATLSSFDGRKMGPTEKAALAPGAVPQQKLDMDALTRKAEWRSPPNPSTLSDPKDPFSVVSRMPDGIHKGKPIANQPERRSLVVLGPELAAKYGARPGEIAVANYLHQASPGAKPEVGVLIVPREAFSKASSVSAMNVVMGEANVGSRSVGVGHAQILFQLDPQHPARFVPQRTDANPADVANPKAVTSFVYSPEATAPATASGAEAFGYDAAKGMEQGTFGLSDTLRSETYARSQFTKKAIPYRLEVSDDDKRRLFQSVLVGVGEVNRSSYNTATNSCATRTLDVIDRAMGHTFQGKGEASGGRSASDWSTLVQALGAEGAARFVEMNPYFIKSALTARGLAVTEQPAWVHQ